MSEAVDLHVECTIQGGCGSSDGMVVYDDGHKHCYACDETEQPVKGGRIQAKEGQVAKTVAKGFVPLSVDYFKNKERCLSLDTVRKFGYGEGLDNKKRWAHITPRRNQAGEVIGQKLRYKDKGFVTVGASKGEGEAPTLWGQHLWQSGKKLVITEGEIDCMSMYEAMGSKWPVVSLPDGASSAKKVLAGNSKWLDGFEQIILCFDQDAAGEKATKDAISVLPPGKAYVMRMPLKDANEMHRAGRDEELRNAMFNARQQRPDAILGGADLWTEFTKTMPNSYISLPHSGLQDMWQGWRDGEIILIGAGSGVGKTTLIKQFMGSALDQGDKVGCVLLEENIRRQMQGMMTYYAGFPVHLEMMSNYSDLPKTRQDELKAIWEDKLKDKLELYNHFGVMDPKELVRNLRYMAVGLGCRTLVLDHITMIANGAEDGKERQVIDHTMNMLRSMVEETGSRLIVVSHLNRPQGRPFEEGAQVHLGSFRGSTQLVCLSDNVLGVERNQQHPTNSDYTRLRSLKCRITGGTGVAGWMHYNRVTGRMEESAEPEGGMLGGMEESVENEAY